ncbi:MAG: NDUFA4 family protein [Bacteroidia bacterium]|nr:NDUFA4 family protein [Bacteroidia bacterium]
METERTDKEILTKGIRLMTICLLLMFAGPFMMHVAFSNQEMPLFIPLFIAAIALCAMAIYFLFRGINTIIDSIFRKK